MKLNSEYIYLKDKNCFISKELWVQFLVSPCLHESQKSLHSLQR